MEDGSRKERERTPVDDFMLGGMDGIDRRGDLCVSFLLLMMMGTIDSTCGIGPSYSHWRPLCCGVSLSSSPLSLESRLSSRSSSRSPSLQSGLFLLSGLHVICSSHRCTVCKMAWFIDGILGPGPILIRVLSSEKVRADASNKQQSYTGVLRSENLNGYA